MTRAQLVALYKGALKPEDSEIMNMFKGLKPNRPSVAKTISDSDLLNVIRQVASERERVDSIKDLKTTSSIKATRARIANELNALRNMSNEWLAPIKLHGNTPDDPYALGELTTYSDSWPITSDHLSNFNRGQLKQEIHVRKSGSRVGATTLHELWHSAEHGTKQVKRLADKAPNADLSVHAEKAKELATSIGQAWDTVESTVPLDKRMTAFSKLAFNLGGSGVNARDEINANLFSHMALGSKFTHSKDWKTIKEAFNPVMEAINKGAKLLGYKGMLKWGVIPPATIATMAAIDQNNQAEALGRPIPRSSAAHNSIVRNPKLASSRTFRELSDFIFPQGPLKGRMIADVVKNEKTQKWFLILDNDAIVPATKAETWSMAAELGTRRYEKLFKRKDPGGQFAQAAKGLGRKYDMEVPTWRRPETETLLNEANVGPLTSLQWVNVKGKDVQLIKAYADLLENWGVVKKIDAPTQHPEFDPQILEDTGFAW